jgi:hypothetical protein
VAGKSALIEWTIERAFLNWRSAADTLHPLGERVATKTLSALRTRSYHACEMIVFFTMNSLLVASLF